MRKYINGSGVPLSVAVYLATDTYDHEEDTISATKLIKPTRQIILASRVPAEQQLVDIVSLVKSRNGTAIHDSIERAWLTNYATAMKSLGYPQRVIDKVVVNPEPGTDLADKIPVYLELRSYREVDGITVSGKFDFAAEGRLEDFKNTSVNTWLNGNKTDDYRLQGSLYRWLNPKILTADHMAIQFIFSDWMPGRAKTDPNYPSKPTEQKLIPLLSVEETESYVRNKLGELRRYEKSPEKDLPLCSDKELWRSDPQYKYYKNPEKRTRSTKNFSNPQDAYRRLAEDGNVGVVVEVPGQVVACKYCEAFPVCSQKDALIKEGSLII